MGTVGKIVTAALLAFAIVGVTVAITPPDKLAKFGAWAGVVAGDMEENIDELLGKEKVLRQQAVDAIQAAQADIGRLQEIAIASRVDAELLQEKVDELHKREADLQRQLGQLASLIEAGEPIVMNGTTWESADLERYAQRKITEFQTIQERIRVYEESRRIQEETAVRAERAFQVAQQNVANMRASLDLLDAKLALLQALKAEPASVGRAVDAPAVLSETDALIQGLLEEVEREIRIADQRQTLQRQPPADLAEPLPDEDDGQLVEQLYELAGQR